jgi:chromosomal replication initiation ATPase DnaA
MNVKKYNEVKKQVLESESDVIFIDGRPGAGKTFLSREYGEVFNCNYVDCYDKATLDFPTEVVSDVYIFDEVTRLIWTAFVEHVNYLVSQGSRVIILSQRPLNDKTRKFFTNESYVFSEFSF